MESIDYSFRGDPYGGDEEGGALFDNDVDEGVELTVGIVVVCFSGGRVEGGEGEVDAEGEGGGGEGGFEVVDHGSELGGGVAESCFACL